MATQNTGSTSTTVKTPHGRNAADRLLAATGQLELEARLIEAARDRNVAKLNARIDEVKQHADRELQALGPQIEANLWALWRWHRGNLKRYGSGRTIELPSGTIGMKRDSAPTVEVVGDPKEAVKEARRRGLRFLSIKVSLDKRTIAAKPSRFRTAKNIRVNLLDRFFAKPNLLHGLKAPKDDRLRTPVKTISAR